MSHTHTPWEVANGVDIRSGPQGAMAYVSTGGGRGRTLDEAKANTRRIVAAINGTAFLTTEALEQGVVGELLAAAEAFRKQAGLALECWEEQHCWDVHRDAKLGEILAAMCGRLRGRLGELDRAHAVLAKAKIPASD